MRTQTPAGEPRAVRRVFANWSIEIPASFVETFVLEDGYWHAYDEDRSVSLTSIVVTDRDRLVSSAELLENMPGLDGSPLEEVPPTLSGRAVTGAASWPALATSILQGVLAAEGRMLLVTITGDDLDWARGVWLSIRNHSAPVALLH